MAAGRRAAAVHGRRRGCLSGETSAAIASIIGMIVGFLITLYCLILPFTLEALTGTSSFTDLGPWGISFLKPYQLFGLDIFNSTSNAFFWSFRLLILFVDEHPF